METRSFSVVMSLKKLSDFQDNAACKKIQNIKKYIFLNQLADKQMAPNACLFPVPFSELGSASGLPLEPPHPVHDE